jgi:hypothetical protein
MVSEAKRNELLQSTNDKYQSIVDEYHRQHVMDIYRVLDNVKRAKELLSGLLATVESERLSDEVAFNIVRKVFSRKDKAAKALEAAAIYNSRWQKH